MNRLSFLRKLSAEDFLVKGESLSSLKKYEEAIAYYDKAIELNPREPKYYNVKEIALHFLNKTKLKNITKKRFKWTRTLRWLTTIWALV